MFGRRAVDLVKELASAGDDALPPYNVSDPHVGSVHLPAALQCKEGIVARCCAQAIFPHRAEHKRCGFMQASHL